MQIDDHDIKLGGMDFVIRMLINPQHEAGLEINQLINE